MADTPENNSTVKTNEQNGQFAIQKVYTKDISFETPNSPGIFGKEWDPSVNMQIANEASVVSEELENLYEVVLRVTVTVNVGEKTAYLAEVQQGGIFHIAGFPKDAISHMLATICPNILFPFAREVVSDLVTRGGFPQLLLAPVNFEVLYAQQQQKARQQQNTEVGSEDITETKH